MVRYKEFSARALEPSLRVPKVHLPSGNQYINCAKYLTIGGINIRSDELVAWALRSYRQASLAPVSGKEVLGFRVSIRLSLAVPVRPLYEYRLTEGMRY